LEAHAAAHGHRPWLFHPFGMDWRWTSWQEAAGEVERLRREAGGTDGWPERPERDGLLAALAGAPGGDARAMEPAAGWAAALDGRRDPRERCDVWVAGSFARPLDRELLSWSLLSGAALVLPGEPARRVAAALWTRPTVFSGDADEIALLVEGVEEGELFRLWQRLRRRSGALAPPLGRLHTVIVDGPEPLPSAAGSWLSGRGVQVLQYEETR
jgi:hypothetical protein